MEIECEYCLEGVAKYLGKLGKIAWYRCRNCGCEMSVEGDFTEQDEEEYYEEYEKEREPNIRQY